MKAEAMSYHTKSEHYQMVLKAGDLERCMVRLSSFGRAAGGGKVILIFMLRSCVKIW